MAWNERKTKNDEKDFKARIADASESYNEVIASAKKCLESPLFAKYSKDFEATSQKLIDLLLDLPLGDPVLFAFTANDLREKLKAMRSLGYAVNTAALLRPRSISKPEKEPAS